MTVIRFHCDRCHQSVEGAFSANGTTGFYDVSQPDEMTGYPGGSWKAYGLANETFVCDYCVHAMPEYQAVYGDHRFHTEVRSEDAPRFIDVHNDWTDDPDLPARYLRQLCDALWRHQEIETWATHTPVIVACSAIAGNQESRRALDNGEEWRL